MTTLKFLIRLAAFIIPILGYSFTLCAGFKIKSEFTFAAVFSGIMAVMYIAGLFNVLNVTQYIIIIFGGLLFLYHCFVKRPSKEELREFFTVPVLLYLAVCTAAAILYRSAILTMGDNFSHWAVMVRQMLNNLRFPNFENYMIIFKTYLPGSALHIFYIAHIFEDSEAVMLISQIILSLSYILCLFAFPAKTKHRYILYFALCVLSLYLLCGASYMNELLVDSLLAQAAFANFAVIWYYRKSPRKAIALNFLFMCALLLIKDSGKIFAILNMALLLCIIIKNRKTIFVNRLSLIKTAALLIIPFLLAALWIPHVKLSFGDNSIYNSTHSIVAERLEEIYSQKEDGVLSDTAKQIFQTAFSFKNDGFTALVGINLAIAALCLTAKRTGLNIKRLLYVLLLCDAVYIVYNLMLILLYAFSMTAEETQRLAGYDRYIGSVSIYLYAAAATVLMTSEEEQSLPDGSASNNMNVLTAVMISLMLIVPSAYIAVKDNFAHFALSPHLPQYSPYYAQMDSFAEQIPHSYAYSYVVADCPEEGGHTTLYYSICSFKMNSYRTVMLNSVTDVEKFIADVSGYDYLLVAQSNAALDELLSPFTQGESAQGRFFSIPEICSFYAK